MKYILIMLFTFQIYAESEIKNKIQNAFGNVQFLKIKYTTTKKNQNIVSIYKEFTKKDVIVNEKSEFLNRTKLSNSLVDNWKNIEDKTRFSLYLELIHIDEKKLLAYDKKMFQKFQIIKENIKKLEKNKTKPQGWRASLFYMVSVGKFQQENPTRAQLSFFQNSPVTLGIASSYYPQSIPYNFSGSLYFSTLVAATNNINQNELSIPAEIGITSYIERYFDQFKFKFSGYSGFDFERFSSLNLEGLQNNQELLADEHKVFYLTIGASKTFTIFKKNFFSKLSISRSIFSSTTLGYSQSTDSTEISGFKFMGYIFHKIHKDWFAHSLIKYHTMSGSSDLSSFRFGIGIGYILK
ncbi:MAG: hypothetical protein H6622_11195 [Halobacteriovoraceae bacterium]|nr:hypothetical protein [Halobacteriovoraceae bacterium]